MSNATPINASGSATATPTTQLAKDQLNMATFMKLLTVQLEHQDPLEPMKDTDFFAQLAQLGQVQGMDTLNKDSEVQKAQSLMGKSVTAIRPMTDNASGQNQLVTGTVSKLSIRNGVYYLGIQEANGGIVDVTMDSIQSIAPTQDMAQATAFIGKMVAGNVSSTVNGVLQTTQVAGQVIGVSTDSGRIALKVKDAKGNLSDMLPGDVQNVLG